MALSACQQSIANSEAIGVEDLGHLRTILIVLCPFSRERLRAPTKWGSKECSNNMCFPCVPLIRSVSIVTAARRVIHSRILEFRLNRPHLRAELPAKREDVFERSLRNFVSDGLDRTWDVGCVRCGQIFQKKSFQFSIHQCPGA